ncbi:MAG: hypothetical protein ACRD51_06230 [Candidatus Acidiferrum sp.]
MRRIAAAALLVSLTLVFSIPSLAQEGMTGAEYGRQTQIEAKKMAKQQRRAMKKAIKQQRKAIKRVLKAERKAAKQTNHHT